MDCGGVIVKYILFIFNILFVICGILLITFGSIMVSKMGDYSSLESAFNANTVAIVILVLGCVILLISFMGCCGAIREDSCCMSSYAIVMLIMFICQIVLIAYVWIQRPEILSSIDKIVQKVWDERATDQPVMDTLQKSFKCCGYRGFADYLSPTLPASCCDSPTNGSCIATQAITRPGCSKALTSFWEHNINIIKYAGLGVAGVELVAFIFAICLANQVRNNNRRMNY